MRISLLKRWRWLTLSGLLTTDLALALNLPLAVMITATLTVPVLLGSVIAVDSWRRHLND